MVKNNYIPQIIHQIWLNESEIIPPSFDLLADSWKNKNPGWTYILWTKNRIDIFLKEYPKEEIFYKRLPYNIQKVDFFRYLILIKFGGVYADVDFECLRAIDAVLLEKKIFFALEPPSYAKYGKNNFFLGNCFIASIPQHYFLKGFVEYIITNFLSFKEKNKFSYVMGTTGPMILNEFYHKCQDNTIGLLEHESVCPFTAEEAKEYYHTENKDKYRERLKKSYAIHLFSGTWLLD